MKVFKYSLLLLLFLLIGDRIVSFGLSKIADRNIHGQSGGDLNYYLNHAPRASLVIIGNSRAYRHFDPDSLSDNGYNLSHNGMHLPFHGGVISLLDDKKKMPDTLILQVEPSSFVYLIKEDLDSIELSYLNNYYYESNYIKQKIKALSRFENFKYLFSSYRFNGKVPGLLKSLLSNAKSNPNRNGFSPLKYNPNDSIRLRKQLIQKKKIDKQFENYLKQYIVNKSPKAKVIIDYVREVCAKNKTHLIVVVSPNYTVPNKSIEVSNKYIGDCLQHNGVDYFNFIDIKMEELNDKMLWRDFEHLNERGAKILSSKLKTLIKK